MTGAPSLVGQPEYDKGKHRYFYNSHGTLIPATRTGYLHAVAAQNRLFLRVALVFLTAAVAITWELALSAYPGQPVFVVPSPGEERARSPAGSPWRPCPWWS